MGPKQRGWPCVYEGNSVREVVCPRGSERKHHVSDQTHGPTRLSPDPPGPLGALGRLLLTLNPSYLHRLMVALTAPWPSQSVPQLGVPHPVPLPHGHRNVTHPTDHSKHQFLMPPSPSSLAGPCSPLPSALSLLGHHHASLCPSLQTWGEGARTWAHGVVPVPGLLSWPNNQSDAERSNTCPF